MVNIHIYKTIDCIFISAYCFTQTSDSEKNNINLSQRAQVLKNKKVKKNIYIRVILLCALLIDYFCAFVSIISISTDYLFQYCRNLSPADADYNLLDVAKRLEVYGVILYPAKVNHCIEFVLFK